MLTLKSSLDTLTQQQNSMASHIPIPTIFLKFDHSLSLEDNLAVFLVGVGKARDLLEAVYMRSLYTIHVLPESVATPTTTQEDLAILS